MKISLSKIIVLVLLITSSLLGKDIISFNSYSKSEFSPTRKQSFNIPFKISVNAKVIVDLYTPDGNKIRTISSAKELKKGKHSLIWDGKDSTGTIVPDEAYVVVLKAINKQATTTIDPRLYSGGEIETSLKTKITLDGKTIYNLSKPSRVLIRAGIKDGPMVRSLINWVPKPKGKNIQHWNGYDADKIVNAIETNRYGIVVVAFALPEYSIITTGNTKLSYLQYYKNKNYKFKQVSKKEQLNQRGNKGISPHYYSFRITDRDPNININFPINIKKNKKGIALFNNNEAIPIKVTMPIEDENFMEKSKYEVSFFVDFEFKSEEELGFMPITWLWSPNALSKGKHILSVNISGFNGQVGVKNIEFEIK